ncbi:MAG: putative toxin-antitoxin system toxin component, PIN family [Chlorobi bacterium]|nr:putative toxin-antitoxin system toxin component, PIN family [Chlorobiota bacterium]
MIKIILDTNVVVSALIQRSFPFLIVNEIFSNDKTELCLSDELFIEYFNVLKRKKFEKYPEFVANAQSLLLDLYNRAVLYHPTIHLHVITDTGDNKLLELAVTCKANFLITGNTNDFTIKEYEGTKIISPRAYWETYIR